jgi:hypothetical protein
VSFICKACNRQRAGASGEICDECWNTKLLFHFENRQFAAEHISALQTILDESQDGPPDGKADGSIDDRRWIQITKLLRTARVFNEALDEVTHPDHHSFANDEKKAKFECDAREAAMLAGVRATTPRTVRSTPPTGSGDFSIASAVWPGTSKLLEEQGELIQVLGKLMATGGDANHWSGDLRKMLVEEIADVCAAVRFFSAENLTLEEVGEVARRTEQKLALFREWHSNPTRP